MTRYAAHTGLDAIVELLIEAAEALERRDDEIEVLKKGTEDDRQERIFP